MAKGIYSALSGALAAESSLDVTANNLANASTAGYQRQRAVFREVLNTASAPRGVANPNRFVALAGTVNDMTIGVTRQTGGKLDAVLPERAFLSVRTPAGDRFTRAGAITLDAEGGLHAAGFPLLDAEGEPISVDPAGLPPELTKDGAVVAGGVRVAQLSLTSFDAPEYLAPEGRGLYAPTPASGIGLTFDGELTVGALEDSNASPTLAMTELIGTTRAFDAVQRAIDAFRTADQKVTTIFGS